MALLTVNDYIDRVATDCWENCPFWSEQETATTSSLYTLANPAIMHDMGVVCLRPSSLETGVTAYRLTSASLIGSTASCSYMLAQLYDLGNLDISTNTFTAGSGMPTVTEGGVSRTLASPIFAEITTALNATPGTLTVTYVDQDGNTAETTTSMTLTASCAANTMEAIRLNVPDFGATSISTAARASGTTPTGVIQFWGMRPLLFVPQMSTGQMESFNYLINNPVPPALGVNEETRLICQGSTAAKAVFGKIFYVGESA